mmetsp:Transcript_89331/g.195887  ORF Transcript_89331/g.195887 Transcript_89331/m.195887 type:complete len:671 (-) Transcript_89331:212-2224(-)
MKDRHLSNSPTNYHDDWTMVNQSPSGRICEGQQRPTSMDVDGRGDLPTTGSLRGWDIEPVRSNRDVELWSGGLAPAVSSRQKLRISVEQTATGKTSELECNYADTLEEVLSRGAQECGSPRQGLKFSILDGEAASTPSSRKGSASEAEAEGEPAALLQRKQQEMILADNNIEKTIASLREHIQLLEDRRGSLKAALNRTEPVIRRLEEEEQWEEEAHDLDGPVEATRPVGLPNLGADCFWQSTLHCLRHLDGFGNILRPALSDAKNPEKGREAVLATAKLLRAMRMAEDRANSVKAAGGGAARPSVRRPAIANFRTKVSEAMRKHTWNDQEPLLLPASDFYEQRQQDAHEFLSLFLDCLSSAPVPEDRPPSPRQNGPIDEESAANLRRLEEDLTAAYRDAARGTRRRHQEYLENLLFEYSMVQWSLSTTRMRSSKLSTLFEGQRLTCIACSRCQRLGVSSAEPFCIEDAKLNSSGNGGIIAQVSNMAQNASFGLFAPSSTSVALKDLLKSEVLAPEGFRCPNPQCQAVGTSRFFSSYLRLPGVLIVHINRAQADESRCESSVKFEEIIDLKDYDLVRDSGNPLDRNFTQCPTKYRLQSAIFHRGPSARCGHYFAYVRWPREGKKTPWAKVDDERVERPSGKAATPSGLEMSEPADGARVVLLFYQREDLL